MAVEKKLQQDKTDDFIRIQDLFYLCLSKWYWFLISLIVTMGCSSNISAENATGIHPLGNDSHQR